MSFSSHLPFCFPHIPLLRHILTIISSKLTDVLKTQLVEVNLTLNMIVVNEERRGSFAFAADSLKNDNSLRVLAKSEFESRLDSNCSVAGPVRCWVSTALSSWVFDATAVVY